LYHTRSSARSRPYTRASLSELVATLFSTFPL
jgi:hypothetical protein